MDEEEIICYELEEVTLLKDLDIKTPNGTSITINGDPIGSGGGGEPVGLPDPTGQTGTWLGVNVSEEYALATIVLPPTVVVQPYSNISDARTAGADTVFWIPNTPTLGVPTNKGVNDVVLYDRSVEPMAFALSDETTALTTGNGKLTVRAPFAFTITAVRASLTTASSTGAVTIDVNDGTTTIFSTPLTIDQGELTSTTAAAAAVISDNAIADDASIRFDIDGAGVGAAGLKVTLYVIRTS